MRLLPRLLLLSASTGLLPILFTPGVNNSLFSPARYKVRGGGCAASNATWQSRSTCPGIIGKSYAASNWIDGWIDPMTGTRKTISWQVSWGGMTVTTGQNTASVEYSPRYIFQNCPKCLPLFPPRPPGENLGQEYYTCCQGQAGYTLNDGTVIPDYPNEGFTLNRKSLSAQAYLWTKCNGQPHVNEFAVTMSVSVGPVSAQPYGYTQTKTNLYRDLNGDGLTLSSTSWPTGAWPGGWACQCWDQNILSEPQFSINLAP